MSKQALPNMYQGDSYSFTLTFPNSTYLTGAPANVKAQVKADPTSDSPDAEFTATVNGAVLTLSIAEVELTPGTYWIDVQVGSTTYLKKTRIIVDGDVSR